MTKPTIIIVTGLPATGKTTLAKKISTELHIPLLSKDVIKELIFDTLGYSDREWSKKVGAATYAIMESLILEEVQASRTVILESNFKPEFDNSKFQELQSKFGFKSVQVLCSAGPDVLFMRYKKRVESGDRHKGHADADNLDEWQTVFNTQISEPLAISGDVIDVDTTDFGNVNYDEIIQKVNSVLSN